jgi:hypothetical protein
MRTNNVGRSLLLALLVLPCAACGAAELRVTQAPIEPLNDFSQVEVSPFRLGLAGNPGPELLQDARNVADFIRTRLAHRLENSKMFDHSGRKLLVMGRIVKFDPGSRAARYLIGPCVGRATMLVEVSLLDERGFLVAQGTVSAEIWGGYFGGSLNSLGKKAMESVFDFIKNNYKKGIPKPHNPPAE